METWKFIIIVVVSIAFPAILMLFTYKSYRDIKNEEDEIKHYPSIRKYKQWSGMFQSVFVAASLPDVIARSTLNHGWPPKPYDRVMCFVVLLSFVGIMITEISKHFEIRRLRSMANAELTQE